jgi:hypothetical protein
MIKERRLKKILISYETQLSKLDLIDLLEALPHDAVFVGCGEQAGIAAHVLVFHSMEWETVDEAASVPMFSPVLRNRVSSDSPPTVGMYRRYILPDVPNPYHIKLPPGYSVDYGKLEERVLGSCTCDLAYTGAKHHKSGCPLRKM